MSAGLLVSSLWKLRKELSKLPDSDGFYANERLMVLHTYLFMSYILFYIAALSTETARLHYDEKQQYH